MDKARTIDEAIEILVWSAPTEKLERALADLQASPDANKTHIKILELALNIRADFKALLESKITPEQFSQILWKEEN